jgi:hypothetical protein
MAGVLNDLGQTIIPGVFAALNNAGLTDTMTVYGESLTSDSGGGFRKTQTTVYSSVPVTYKPNTNNARNVQGERQLSVNEYIVTFPTNSSAGSRYTVTPSHRLVVAARGNEPAKTFRIISIADKGGMVYEAICVKEN